MKVKNSKIFLPDKNYEDEDAKSTASCGCCTGSHPHLDKYFADITAESTIHGIKYIGSNKYHPVERIFWVIIMLTSLGFSIYLILRLLSKYYESPVIISFQPQETFVAQIPFPAITICNVNLLKTSVVTKLQNEFESLLYRYLLGEHDVKQRLFEEGAHLDHLGQFCLQAKSFRRQLNQTMRDANGVADKMQLINDKLQGLGQNDTEELERVERNPSWWREEHELFKNATLSCEEMLLQCMWSGDIVSCKDIFFHVETRNGRCCVFNMMPKFILENMSSDERRAQKEMRRLPKRTISLWKAFAKNDFITKQVDKIGEIKYPKHQKAGGKPYGLTVLVNPILHEYSTCTTNDGWGFKMVAHSPLSAPSIMDYGVAVPSNSEVFVEIEPQITVADPKVLKNIPIAKRGCYMQTDDKAKLRHYNYYSIENCISECVAKYTYLNCSCVRYFMPRNASQSVCGAKKRPCAEAVRLNLTKNLGKNSFCGHCYPACTEVLYKLQMSHLDLRMDNVSSYYTYNDQYQLSQNATNYSIIHIYMGTDSIYAKERKTLYEWSDLVANAGGLLSLTLGVSIISFIEIGYFFSIRAWFEYRSVVKDDKAKPESSSHTTGALVRFKKNIKRRRSSIAISDRKTDEYYDWAMKNKVTVSHSNSTGPKRNAITNGNHTFLF